MISPLVSYVVRNEVGRVRIRSRTPSLNGPSRCSSLYWRFLSIVKSGRRLNQSFIMPPLDRQIIAVPVVRIGILRV